MEKENCAEWLYKRLLNSEACAEDISVIRAEAKSAGYTRGELKWAKDKLRLLTENDSAVTGKAATKWFWELPI